MTYSLSGFKEEGGLRRFAFSCIAADHSRYTIDVCADVNMARKHQIRLQELPLICMRLLDASGDEAPAAAITLTEEQMIGIQSEARMLSEKKVHKAPKKPVRPPGEAWRSPFGVRP